MLTDPKVLLRAEGFLLLGISLVCFRELHASWIVFAVLLLVPDVSLAGYLAGVKVGAPVYNVVHTLVGPLVFLAFAILTAHVSWLPYGLIWTAHIGMDRTLGYGLKYPTQFNDTHLQRV